MPTNGNVTFVDLFRRMKKIMIKSIVQKAATTAKRKFRSLSSSIEMRASLSIIYLKNVKGERSESSAEQTKCAMQAVP